MLNNLLSHTHFWLPTNQITSYNVFIQIHKLNDKQCRSWSDGFFRSHLIWIYTVCKGRGCREQRDKVGRLGYGEGFIFVLKTYHLKYNYYDIGAHTVYKCLTIKTATEFALSIRQTFIPYHTCPKIWKGLFYHLLTLKLPITTFVVCFVICLWF